MGNTFLTEVEMEALENRMNGMSPQEQVFAVQFIDTDILWDELRNSILIQLFPKKQMRLQVE